MKSVIMWLKILIILVSLSTASCIGNRLNVSMNYNTSRTTFKGESSTPYSKAHYAAPRRPSTGSKSCEHTWPYVREPTSCTRASGKGSCCRWKSRDVNNRVYEDWYCARSDTCEWQFSKRHKY